MRIHDFIFSDQPFFRVSRHVAFWLVIPSAHIAYDMAFAIKFPYNIEGIGRIMAGLLLQMIPTYITLYFLIPRYLLRKKYRAFVFAVIILSILLPILYLVDPVTYLLDPAGYLDFRSPLFDGVLNKDDRNVLKMCHLVAWWRMVHYPGFASMIKLLKLYYIENSENKRLHSLKVNHEINLLKSQLNSRFLLNALHNIRDHVRNGSSAASGLLLQLSDLLSYILYENDEKHVPLLKEIAMIEGYLSLENEGVQDNVNAKVTIQGKMDKMEIVPLLLLPLVESCFENSAIGGRNGTSSVFIDFNVEGMLLSVTLTINNLNGINTEPFQKSIRIKNVRQRLASYYEGNHRMEVFEENEKQIIHLTLAL